MHLLLPYFIILIVLIQLKLRKNSKKNAESDKNYLQRESEANNVRKKSIDNLDYIIIPEHMMFDDVSCLDTEFTNLTKVINDLRSKKILNLTGYTNTDLKLEYGAGNLATLTEYDDNYASLARTIVAMGKLLIDKNYTDAAVELLELGIASKTDISANYTLLADYYREINHLERINHLIDVAGELKSLNRNVILNKLKTYA